MTNRKGVGFSLLVFIFLAAPRLACGQTATPTITPTPTFIGGGGSTSTDCFVAYNSVPAPNSPAASPKHVKCVDDDVACGDADVRLGYCKFQVQMSLNTTGFPGCSPHNFPAGSFLIPYSGAMNDDHPKHINDFEPLQQFVVNDALPLTTADTNVDSGLTDVTVPMKIAFTANGPVFKTTTLKLHPTMCTVALDSKGHCPSPALKDVDTFNIICAPKVDGMGNPISACTGITSTFQQIQEHIFDRKCSNLATCHGSPYPAHDLCLKPPCNGFPMQPRDVYTDLVGVTPHNALAAADGLKRVDANGVNLGNPTTSLLIHKLNGGSQLNSVMFGTAAYGLRMPYNNPQNGRSRPKLTGNERQLITDWIMAGAPMSGFVTTTAKGACQ